VDRAAPEIHHATTAARAKPQVTGPDEFSAPTGGGLASHNERRLYSSTNGRWRTTTDNIVDVNATGPNRSSRERAGRTVDRVPHRHIDVASHEPNGYELFAFGAVGYERDNVRYANTSPRRGGHRSGLCGHGWLLGERARHPARLFSAEPDRTRQHRGASATGACHGAVDDDHVAARTARTRD
jgi:hypothetical protein